VDPDATAHPDGGGHVRTALRPVTGAEKIARLFLGVLRKEPGVAVTEEYVNGRPGLVGRVDGTTVAVISIQIDNGIISHIRLMMNPEKLDAWNTNFPG
jgi:hypothetical protein